VSDTGPMGLLFVITYLFIYWLYFYSIQNSNYFLIIELSFFNRDLKPENILLNDGMHIQITDFGSAKILDKEEEERRKQEKTQSMC